MFPRHSPTFLLALLGVILPSATFAAVVATDVVCTTRCISATEIGLNSISTGHVIDGTLTNADLSASAAISAAKIADGSGSTLDADFFDSLDSSQFLRSDQTGTLTGSLELRDSTPEVNLWLNNTGTDGQSWLLRSTNAASGHGGGKLIFDIGGVDKVTITPDARVGISTTTPHGKLDIGPSEMDLAKIVLYGDGTANSYRIGTESGGGIVYNVDAADSSHYHAFSFAGNAAVVIEGNGHVGIGTNHSDADLHVNNSTAGGLIRVSGNNGLYGLYMGADLYNPYIGSYTNHDLRLVTNASEKMRITAAGLVGIGKTPSYPLDVNGAINASDFCLNGDCSFGDGSTSTTTSDTQAYPDSSLSDHSSTSTVGTIAYYLNAMKTTGGTIHLGAGTYTLGGPIELASNITIVGTGTNSIIKLKEGVDKRMIRNPGASDGSDGTAISNVTLQDFTLDGGSSASDEDCLVFDASDSSTNDNINISGLTVENCGGNGILIVDAKKVRLNNLYLLDNGTITVDKSYPDHNIYLRNVYDVALSNVLSTGSTSDGVHIADGEKVSVDNVVAWDNTGRGIFLGGVYYGSVSNATVYGNDDNGIELGGDSADSEKSNSRNLSISGCSVTQNDESVTRSLSAPAGIYVRDTTALTINGCVVRKNNYGIVLATGSIDVIVSGNTSIGNSAYGVYVGSGAEDVMVDGNDLQDNTSGSFKEDSSDAEIKTGDNL